MAITASRAGQRRSPAPARAYPLAELDDDADAVAALLAATRALLSAETPQQAAAVVATFVHDLGGGLVPARFVPDSTSMPLDVSLGLAEPVLPWAEPVSVAAMRLDRLLPAFVEDARAVVSRLQGAARLTWEAEHDAPTGLLTRPAWMRRLSTAAEGELVCLVRLEGADDGALASAGDLLLDALRGCDACGRYGAQELACVVRSGSAQDLVDALDQVRSRWHAEPSAGRSTVLSAGVAVVGPAGPPAAVIAAERALARAGRGTLVATSADHLAAP